MPQSLDMKIAYAWKTAAVGTSFVGFGLVFAWTARQDDPRWGGNFAADVYRHIELHAHNGLCFLWVPQRIFSKLKGTVSRDCRPFLFKWILYWHHINKQKIIAKFFDFTKILQIELCILIWRKQNRSQTVCEEEAR